MSVYSYLQVEEILVILDSFSLRSCALALLAYYQADAPTFWVRGLAIAEESIVAYFCLCLVNTSLYFKKPKKVENLC